ncbi:MAG: NADH-quinone oxidoreductase subunit A [Pseudomonadota bacterium]|nr:NADH-quinone oxidoreductase subunit A [Pseudomonadota bacterium]
MLENYFLILLFIGVCLFVCLSPLILSLMINRSKDVNNAKTSPYECGFDHFGDARMKFDVRYYLIAILFIIFDLEIAFLFPWAVTIKTIGLESLIAMSVFLFVLIIGFIYEWKKGALDWD